MLVLPDAPSHRHAVLLNRRVIPLPRARALLESLAGHFAKTPLDKLMNIFNKSFISIGGSVLTMMMLHPYKDVRCGMDIFGVCAVLVLLWGILAKPRLQLALRTRGCRGNF